MFTRRESASTKQERGHHMDVPPGENQQVPNKRGAIIMDVPLGENQQVLKGTVSRDFLTLVFSSNNFSLSR
jgi:hypothetical protein